MSGSSSYSGYSHQQQALNNNQNTDNTDDTMLRSWRQYFHALRPPAYYKVADQLRPPTLPDEIRTMETSGNEKCSPYGTFYTFKNEKDGLLKQMFKELHKSPACWATNVLDKDLSTQLEYYQSLKPEQLKELLINVTGDYLARLFQVNDELCLRADVTQMHFDGQYEKYQLTSLFTYLKYLEGRRRLSKALEDRLETKRAMIKLLQQQRNNIVAGVPSLNKCEFPSIGKL